MHLSRLSNRQVLLQLNELVHGHQEAKKVLINLIYRSKLRHYQQYGLMMKDNYVSTTNCLLLGGSGTGKTHLVESLQKICHFPLVTIDALQLTPTGTGDDRGLKYINTKIKENAEELVKSNLYYHSIDGVIAQTVVFFDEFDKLAKAHDSSGNWNRQIQATLLRLVENKAQYTGLSFIFAGAFSDMSELAKHKPSGIGFNLHKPQVDNDVNYDEAIIKYGLIPEIVGRVHNVVALDKLTLDDYKHILLNNIIPKKMDDLRHYNIEFPALSAAKVTTMCEKARNSDQGVRMLHKQIERYTLDVEFHAEENRIELECTL